MTSAKYDVLGIGNAIFDVLAQTEEGFLVRHGMTKGGMALIDEGARRRLYGEMGPARDQRRLGRQHRCRGRRAGAVAPAIIGRVADDQLGGFTPMTSAPPASPIRYRPAQ